MDLNDIADKILSNKSTQSDEIQSVVHPELLFRYNSVNLVIGKRGSGKTYMIGREIIKLCYSGSNYSSVYYITDKKRDDTFEYVQNNCKNLEIVWVETKDAIKLINTLTKAKANLCNEEWCKENPDDEKLFRKALNADSITGIPHTLIVFDDCIGLFKKESPLSKKLFENRQSRITYILALQDVTGLSPSMKSNIDSLVLFGEFPRQKWNILTYQLPIIEGFDWDLYQMLKKHDYFFVDFTANLVYTYCRHTGDFLSVKNERLQETIDSGPYELSEFLRA